MHEQDLSKIQTSIVPFPSLHASQASPTIEDPFKETAVAEGASVDQISYSCARGLPLVSSVSLDLVSNKSPESHRKSSPRGVGGECIADVSTTSIDVPESIADFTLLAIDWPQPPCHISTEPDTTRGVKSDSEVRGLRWLSCLSSSFHPNSDSHSLTQTLQIQIGCWAFVKENSPLLH